MDKIADSKIATGSHVKAADYLKKKEVIETKKVVLQ